MPTNTSTVIYTGLALPYIGVTPNQTLDVILGEINTAVNNLNPSPNFSGFNYGPYNGYTVTTTTGGVPSTIQEFVEGISKIVDIDQYNLDNFINVTYAGDVVVLGAAISALQTPALTYSVTAGGGSIVITSGMTRNQVLTATYTGVGSILNLLAAPGNTWGSLSISTPDNILDAFNALINYLGALDTTISGLQPAIGTFDNSGNCLATVGGGATDIIATTVGYITTYICTALPTFDTGAITWGCITPQSDLQDTIQALITSASAVRTNYITAAGTGLTTSAIGGCAGVSVAIDDTWDGLYKVMLSSGDTTADADFLDQKVESLDSSITMAITGNKLNMTVTTPVDNKVKVNASDATAGYLEAKIPSMSGGWGISITSTPTPDNSQLQLIPNVTDPTLFITNLFSYISSDPDLLAQFCALKELCTGCLCDNISDLLVVLGMGSFDLTWVPSGTASYQIAKYRQRGFTEWITGVNFTPPNPLLTAATTTSVGSLDNNIVYQFQIDSVCSGDVANSNIYEAIRYNCQTLTAVVVAGVISVSQPSLVTIDTIEYQLFDSDDILVDNQTATGLNPQAKFASQSADTYHVNWRYGTLVNGVMLYSDYQLEAWCTLTGIIIS